MILSFSDRAVSDWRKNGRYFYFNTLKNAKKNEVTLSKYKSHILNEIASLRRKEMTWSKDESPYFKRSCCFKKIASV